MENCKIKETKSRCSKGSKNRFGNVGEARRRKVGWW